MSARLIGGRHPFDSATSVEWYPIEVSLCRVVGGGDEVSASLLLIDAGDSNCIIGAGRQERDLLIARGRGVDVLPAIWLC